MEANKPSLYERPKTGVSCPKCGHDKSYHKAGRYRFSQKLSHKCNYTVKIFKKYRPWFHKYYRTREVYETCKCNLNNHDIEANLKP